MPVKITRANPIVQMPFYDLEVGQLFRFASTPLGSVWVRTQTGRLMLGRPYGSPFSLFHHEVEDSAASHHCILLNETTVTLTNP